MPEKMKAVVKTFAGFGNTEIRSVDVPSIGPRDVLIKVDVCSICGTDVHIYNWDQWAAARIKPPLIYGHEFAGKVVEIGSEVSEVSQGDYVSGECHITCGHCFQCRTGNAHICERVKIFGVDVSGIFAEYAAIPASNVWKNDPLFPPELCSIQDPIGNAVHSISLTDVAGKDVVVIGLGPIGIITSAILQHSGASQVFGIEKENLYRAELAKEVGATDVYIEGKDDVAGEIKRMTGGKGADVVFEMSGSKYAVRRGLEILRPGGEMILLGVYSEPVTLDLSEQVVFKYVTVKGVNGRRIFEDWYKVSGLLKNEALRKSVMKVITHEFSFDDFLNAMDLMRSGNSGKIVLHL